MSRVDKQQTTDTQSYRESRNGFAFVALWWAQGVLHGMLLAQLLRTL